MRPFSTLVFALVLGGLACFASSASATVLIQDTFEGHDLGAIATPPTVGATWIGGTNRRGSAGVGVLNVTTAAAPGATNAGKFLGTTGADPLGVVWMTTADEASTLNQVVTFHGDFYMDSTGGNMEMYGLASTSDTYWKGSSWYLRAKPDGHVDTYTGGWNPSVTGTFLLNQWNSFTVVADYSAKTYTANIGGVVFSAGFETDTGYDTHTVGGLALGTGGASAGGYYDNLTVTTTPEPSSIALVTSGLVGLLAYAWRKRK
jgi:hypothetical protein